MKTELRHIVETYIKEKGYDWSFDDIMKQWSKYKDGYYISFTAKDVVENCIEPYFNTIDG